MTPERLQYYRDRRESIRKLLKSAPEHHYHGRATGAEVCDCHKCTAYRAKAYIKRQQKKNTSNQGVITHEKEIESLSGRNRESFSITDAQEEEQLRFFKKSCLKYFNLLVLRTICTEKQYFEIVNRFVQSIDTSIQVKRANNSYLKYQNGLKKIVKDNNLSYLCDEDEILPKFLTQQRYCFPYERTIVSKRRSSSVSKTSTMIEDSNQESETLETEGAPAPMKLKDIEKFIMSEEVPCQE